MRKTLLIRTIAATIFVLAASTILIFLAKGYTYNTKLGTIQKTGILLVTSEPRDAAVYVDDVLKGTTNTKFDFLSPGKYKIKVTKDGFTPWEKEIEIRAELVSRVDAFLFPQVPDLKRLTISGVKNVFASPDNTKLVYYVSEPTKKGIWAITLADPMAPIPFVSSDPIQVLKDNGAFDLANATYLISPDNNSLLVVDGSKMQQKYALLDLTRTNDTITVQKETDIANLLTTWLDSSLVKQKNLRERLVHSVKDIPAYENPQTDITPVLDAIDTAIATGSASLATAAASASPTAKPSVKTLAKASLLPSATPTPSQAITETINHISQVNNAIKWSLRQDRVIFTTQGLTKVYDLTTGRYATMPQADSVSWLPTNFNVILINPNGHKGEIAIADFDGSNPVVVFSGQFVDSIAVPWKDGTKLVVLTNLNQAAGSDPNLYAINLR